jgi:hypothetical protein
MTSEMHDIASKIGVLAMSDCLLRNREAAFHISLGVPSVSVSGRFKASSRDTLQQQAFIYHF